MSEMWMQITICIINPHSGRVIRVSKKQVMPWKNDSVIRSCKAFKEFMISEQQLHEQ